MSATLLTSTLRAETTKSKASPIAIGAEIGTAGYGPIAIVTATKHLTASIGYTWFDFDYDTSSGDSDYTGKLKLKNIQGIVNWHPFAGTFHLSAGAFITNNKVDVIGKLKPGNTYDIGGASYTSAQVGTLTGNVELTKGTVPYIGLGWAKKPTKSGFGIFANAGVLFTSAPEAKLNSIGGTLSSDPTLQANLRKEEKDVNKDLKPLRYYPVAQFGLMYRF